MSRIDAIVIKNPCSASWAEMDGEGGARFCRLCSKVVTDTTSLTACELEKMLAAPETPCLRVQRDGWGRVLTLDRLATAAFLGLAACTGGGPDTAPDTAQASPSAEARPMGMGTRPSTDAQPATIAETVARVREEARTRWQHTVDTTPVPTLHTLIGDVEPPPPIMGGVAPMMGEPSESMGKIAIIQ